MSNTVNRKAEHVRICVDDNVTHRSKLTGFDDLEFEHNALPEISFKEIDTSTTLLGHPLSQPLIISSMTGGYAGAFEINRALAEAVHHFGLAMGVGSERQALENSDHHDTFKVVRKEAPNAFIFANIGGVELARLNRESKLDRLRVIIDLIEAQALAVHLNPLQELMQPEGTPDFRGILSAIETVAKTAGLPVIVKEVGAGISKRVATQLLDAGVAAIDVAGAGGTSWAGVEILRTDTSLRPRLEPFWDWGIPTVQAIMEVASLRSSHTFDLIASGGIRNGLDIAKSLSLGAQAAGMARPLISAFVQDGSVGLGQAIEDILFQLKAVMFLTGSSNIKTLQSKKLFFRS